MKTPKNFKFPNLRFLQKEVSYKLALAVNYSWKVQALSSEATLVIYLVKVADFLWANYFFSVVQYYDFFQN